MFSLDNVAGRHPGGCAVCGELSLLVRERPLPLVGILPLPAMVLKQKYWSTVMVIQACRCAQEASLPHTLPLIAPAQRCLTADCAAILH